jgi:hypothetical protein
MGLNAGEWELSRDAQHVRNANLRILEERRAIPAPIPHDHEDLYPHVGDTSLRDHEVAAGPPGSGAK